MTSISFILIFFFSSSAPHRHLPSFPTRRSSDLIVTARRPAIDAHAGRIDIRVFRGDLADHRDMIVEPDFAEILPGGQDRKSTRLNSSHSQISYAVFCLKKKKKRIHKVITSKITS